MACLEVAKLINQQEELRNQLTFAEEQGQRAKTAMQNMNNQLARVSYSLMGIETL